MSTLLPTFQKYLLLCLFLAGFAGVSSLRAQTAPKARYDAATKVLSLDANAPFTYLFELDLTPLKLASAQAAETFFSDMTTDLVSFQVHFDQKKADVLLRTRLRPQWTVKEWNEYLASLPRQ